MSKKLSETEKLFKSMNVGKKPGDLSPKRYKKLKDEATKIYMYWAREKLDPYEIFVQGLIQGYIAAKESPKKSGPLCLKYKKR